MLMFVPESCHFCSYFRRYRAVHKNAECCALRKYRIRMGFDVLYRIYMQLMRLMLYFCETIL